MGRRFLFLAGGQVGSQTCAAVQLKGAAFGVRVPGCVKPGPRLLPRGALGEGPGGAPFVGGGAELPGPHLTGGQAGALGGVSEQIGLPARRQLPGICSASSYSPAAFSFRVRRPLSPRASLAAAVPALAARPAGHRLLAAHSSLHRESGPPRRRRRWEAGAGTKLTAPPLPDLSPSATPSQGSPPPAGPPPKKTRSRQKPEAHATTGWRKKSG